jgi:hypothetical protein
LSIVDVVVVAVDVDTTVGVGGVGGVGGVCTGVTVVAVPEVEEPPLKTTAPEADGTATAPAIPRAPTVLIAPAKMMLRRLVFIVLVPFRENVAMQLLTTHY